MAAIKLTHQCGRDNDGPPRSVLPADARLDAVGTISSDQIQTSIRAAHEYATDMMLYHRLQAFGSALMEDGAARTTREELTMVRYLELLSQRTAREMPELGPQAADLAQHYADMAHHGVEKSLELLIDRTKAVLSKELPRYEPPPPAPVMAPRRGVFARLFGTD